MFTSATQLKAWVKNKSNQTGIPANVILHSYMMERFLERLSLSQYRENIILKGGLLIASMVGIENRSTMDMDTTIKGQSYNKDELRNLICEIIEIDAGDDVSFEIQNIKKIHDSGDYDDFRLSLIAFFHTIRVHMKLDLTAGDEIIPREIEYSYKLLFEDRTISIMAYNLYSILAEKIETILSRNTSNTRARDFYDVYILLTLNSRELSSERILDVLNLKAIERGSIEYIEEHEKHLADIAESEEIAKIWAAYCDNYHYAEGINMKDVISKISRVFGDINKNQ